MICRNCITNRWKDSVDKTGKDLKKISSWTSLSPKGMIGLFSGYMNFMRFDFELGVFEAHMIGRLSLRGLTLAGCMLLMRHKKYHLPIYQVYIYRGKISLHPLLPWLFWKEKFLTVNCTLFIFSKGLQNYDCGVLRTVHNIKLYV